MTQTVDTPRSGNTNTEAGARSRAFMITIYEDDLVHFPKAVYECWCDDTCKDGKPHKHQLVYFRNRHFLEHDQEGLQDLSHRGLRRTYMTALLISATPLVPGKD